MVRPARPVEWEVIFEPMPIKVREYRGQRINWEKRLAPVKAAPGAQARVMRCDNESQKNYYIRTMKAYLRKEFPLEKWEFEGARMPDQRGGYGIWAVYRGLLSPGELAEIEMKHAQRSEIMRKAYARKQIRDTAKEYAEGIVRPFPGRG